MQKRSAYAGHDRGLRNNSGERIGAGRAEVQGFLQGFRASFLTARRMSTKELIKALQKNTNTPFFFVLELLDRGAVAKLRAAFPRDHEWITGAYEVFRAMRKISNPDDAKRPGVKRMRLRR